MPASYQTIPDETTPITAWDKAGGVEQATHHSSFSWTPKAKKISVGAMVLLGAWCGLVLSYGISPLSADAVPWNFFTASGGANTIKMCVQEMDLITLEKSEGALVACWDKDANGDDKMCEGITGPDGCVVMNYKNQNWDGWGGSYPDIYCSVNKRGFVQSVPPDKDHHPQSKQAVFSATLYRDRSNDYGETNRCGPALTAGVPNDFATAVLQFGKQCFHHDKCYWDCKILQAFGNDSAKAKQFCDDEMLDGMTSSCYWRHGNLPLDMGLEDECLDAAQFVHGVMLGIGGDLIGAYNLECKPDHPSLKNDYDNPAHCSPDGHKCGYDGTTSDETKECDFCCNEGIAKDKGTVWDDWYCKCYPKDFFCGTTLVGKSFNDCDKCCNGKYIDAGNLYSNYYCRDETFTDCKPDGHKCGYDGTTSDKMYECEFCCNEGIAKDEGTIWDDWYCKCLPKDIYCGTTLIGFSFNDCGKCCNGKYDDAGWTYTDYYCRG